jgi:hypothetical protein
MYVHIRTFATTPEDELTIVDGVPTDVEYSTLQVTRRSRLTHHVKFTIDGARIQYDSSRPHYEELIQALQSQEPIKAWIATERTSPFNLDQVRLMHLYKMEHRGQMILNYQEIVSLDEEESMALLICGTAITGGGVLALFSYYRARRKYQLALG